VIEKWLLSGRPMSLVAIGAFKRMMRSDMPRCVLLEPASIDHMTGVLEKYLETDSTTSTRSTIPFIVKNWPYILQNPTANSQQNKANAGELDLRFCQTAHLIKQFISSDHQAASAASKLGGNPNWLQTPEWPLSQSTGEPMAFIGQIKLDKDLFPFAQSEWAYIFMTGSDDAETWDPEGGENAIILQPGDNSHIKTTPVFKGPTLSEISYVLSTEKFNEPENSADDSAGENQFSSKLGGIPAFVQEEDYPEVYADEEWNLIMQLCSSELPFFVNFGDECVGYVLLTSNGKKIWQEKVGNLNLN
jgi:uncharacterized protein YwqG